ncbi:hypothetical protein WMF37_06705 [Sorangium sp. So ce291]|uniref:hypothetical protein n=1 Tax=unclassified Sorangium TaxID=2621164 RepID=UPI003F0F7213
MTKRDDQAAHELADEVYESFKALDPAYATPRVRAGLQEVCKHLMLAVNAELVMGILAARRYREKFLVRVPTREELLDLLDRYLASVAADPRPHPRYQRTVEPTRQMRALLETWEFSLDVPEPIVKVARAWLAANEIDEPPEGWDDWPGPDDAPLRSPSR